MSERHRTDTPDPPSVKKSLYDRSNRRKERRNGIQLAERSSRLKLHTFFRSLLGIVTGFADRMLWNSPNN
jgi:hypothetical protein